MENVIKCPTCHKTVIAEEEFTHKCNFDAIDIPVSDFFTVKKDERESAVGFGLNGKVYRFVKSILPTKTEQSEKFDETTEGETKP